MEQRIKHCLTADFNTGKVYWKNVSKYHLEKLGKEAGNQASYKGDVRHYIQLDGKKLKRSHVIYLLYYGKLPTGVIDHINRNSLDDRPENLRDTDVLTNNHNHSRRNIRKILTTGKYQVRLGNIFSANVETLEDAISLYDRKREELWKT